MSAAGGTRSFTIELPQGVLEPPAATPEATAKELRLAAAIAFCREGRISHGQGALIASMSRVQFLDGFIRAKVPACQMTVDEPMEEVDRAVAAHRQHILPILLTKTGRRPEGIDPADHCREEMPPVFVPLDNDPKHQRSTNWVAM